MNKFKKGDKVRTTGGNTGTVVCQYKGYNTVELFSGASTELVGFRDEHLAHTEKPVCEMCFGFGQRFVSGCNQTDLVVCDKCKGTGKPL